VSLAGALQFGLFLLLLIAFAALLGPYLARVFSGERTLLDPALRPVERLILRALGQDARAEMTAGQYATAFLSFSVVCMIVLYVLLRLAVKLGGGPDPAELGTPLTVDLAFNTAVSFVTTTTWQAYTGENTMTYAVQTAGLTVHSFLAGASGLAVGMAFLRGFVHKRPDAAEPAAATLGNFWVDLVRALLWVLIPGALAGSIFLITQGVPMNLDPYTRATTLEGAPQVIAQGPVAALEFIKNLGTDGGGFFNVNGAHPYANPTPLVSFVQMLAIAALPAAFPIAFGRMAGRRRVGWTILAAMLCLFAAGLAVCQIAETGNLEGKEVRFGVADSVLDALGFLVDTKYTDAFGLNVTTSPNGWLVKQ